MPVPSVITSSLQSFVRLSVHSSLHRIFFFITVSCDHMRKWHSKGAREKGKRYNNASEKWSSLSCLGRVVLKKKEKTTEHVKDNHTSLLKYRPDEGL